MKGASILENPGVRILALVVLFIGALFFYTRHNDFPIFYHPDEETKGVQVVTGERNFHHPLLLLNTADLILRASGEPRTVENAVLSGRRASALFAAIALVALTVLAWRRGGWPGALLAAPVLALHPLLHELAHYCKEDPALLMGMSLSLLALDYFANRPTLRSALLLGGACALAASGKYLGILMLLPALPWVMLHRSEPGLRWKRLGAFAAGFVVLFLVVNFSFLRDWQGLLGAFGYELNAAQVGGAKGLTRDVPHDKYVRVFLENVSWPLLAGLFFFVLGWWIRKKERRGSDLVILFLPLGYALLLSFSPKTANRYFLAVAPFLLLCGSLGLVWLGEFLRTRIPWRGKLVGSVIFGVVAALAVREQWLLTRPNIRSFRTDSRMEMGTWISQNLPVHATILAETRVSLGKTSTWSRSAPRPDLQVTEKTFLPDFGPLETLQPGGKKYFAVIRTSYGGYLSDKRKPSPNQTEQHFRRRQFYAELFQNGRLLKKSGGKGVIHLNPEVRLYEYPLPNSP